MALALLAGCATAVGVKPMDPQAVHRELTGNVLSTGELSQFTENVLRQYAVDDVAAAVAGAALAELHAAVIANPPPDALFALAELSFWQAEGGGGQPHFLAAALYASPISFPTVQALRRALSIPASAGPPTSTTGL